MLKFSAEFRRQWGAVVGGACYLCQILTPHVACGVGNFACAGYSNHQQATVPSRWSQLCKDSTRKENFLKKIKNKGMLALGLHHVKWVCFWHLNVKFWRIEIKKYINFNAQMCPSYMHISCYIYLQKVSTHTC